MNQESRDIYQQGLSILSSKGIQLNLIVAQNLLGAIGSGDAMLWHIPADLAFFKKETMGAQLIMGRKTFDSISKPLPGRRTIVLSSRKQAIRGVQLAHSVIEALSVLEPQRPTYIAGGAMIYQEFESWIKRACITVVDRKISNAQVCYNALSRLERMGLTLEKKITLQPDAIIHIFKIK